MVENDSVLYYVFYGVILIAFYLVLKSPKKENKENDSKKDDN